MRNAIRNCSLAVVLLLLAAATGAWANQSEARAPQQQEAQRPALLVLNKVESTLAIIDPASMKVMGRVPTGEGPHEVTTSADGRLAFVANYGTQQKPGSSISIIDILARKELKRLDVGPLVRPHGIVEAGGKIYFTAEANRAVARYNPATERIDWIMGTGQTATHMLVISPDGRRLYTANIVSDTVTVIALDAPPGPTAIAHIGVGKQPEGIAVTPDGRELWVGQNGDGQISIIDTATLKIKETVKVGQVPIRVKFTPDGKRVLVSDPPKGELVILDAATRKEIKRLTVGEVPVGIVVAPDGRRAFIATMQSNKIVEINLDNLTLARSVETGAGPDGMAWAEKS
ncbi:MAG TPA: beta-propeller fold lactonase family protein [Pyrinomonadaceae bacterium]|jgi:YVTN family beta-propeller protein